MIKKYNQYISEGLNDYLKGPTKQEIELAIEKGDDILKYYWNVKYLLQNKIISIEDILKYLNNDINKLLIYGSQFNIIECVKYAYEHGANINYDNVDALDQSVLRNHIEIVKYLIKCGIDVNSDNSSALKLSTLMDYDEMIILLLKNDAFDKSGISLTNAIEKNNYNIIKLMLEKGMKCNYTGYKYAVKNGNYKIINLLRKYLLMQNN